MTAYPVHIGNCQLTAVAIEDVGAEKRRAVLERTFFHDILNTASGLSGVAELLSLENLPEKEVNKYRRALRSLTENLIHEIQHQRKLLQAEKGELQPEAEEIPIHDLLHDLQRLHLASPSARNKFLNLRQAPEAMMVSDAVLVKRIVGNMIKNALEATPEGGVVSHGCELKTDGVRFWVHNQGSIPTGVRSQLFHRSFTTKAGPGHGIGTYSMKLFGERYLGGRVRFTSDEPGGTFFTFWLPSTGPRVPPLGT